jgi:hypothetical protein
MVDPDYEDYVGAGGDGCTTQVTENDDGTWSTVVIVDSDTGGFCMELAWCDEFKTSDDARFWGRDRSLEWCWENDVNPHEEEEWQQLYDALKSTTALAEQLVAPSSSAAAAKKSSACTTPTPVTAGPTTT